MPPGQVIIPAELYGEAAQRHIAISSPVQRPVFPKALPIGAPFRKNATRLVEFGTPLAHIENFLDRHDIGIQFSDDLRNAFRTRTLIQSLALMYVVAGDTDAKAHC